MVFLRKVVWTALLWPLCLSDIRIPLNTYLVRVHKLFTNHALVWTCGTAHATSWKWEKCIWKTRMKRFNTFTLTYMVHGYKVYWRLRSIFGSSPCYFPFRVRGWGGPACASSPWSPSRGTRPGRRRWRHLPPARLDSRRSTPRSNRAPPKECKGEKY